MAGTPPNTTTGNTHPPTTFDSEIPASVLRDAVLWAYGRLQRQQGKPALPTDVRDRIIHQEWERLYRGDFTAETIATLLTAYGDVQLSQGHAVDRQTLAAWACDLEPRVRIVREGMRGEGEA